MTFAIFDFWDEFKDKCAELATNIQSEAFKLLGKYVTKATTFADFPRITEIYQWAQSIAVAVIALLFFKEIVKAFKAMATEAAEPNFAELLGRTAIGIALVYATPYLIINFLLKINNLVVTGLTTELKIVTHLSRTPSLDAAILWTVLMILIWAICFLVFAITAAIRMAELALALVFGPFAAASYVIRDETYGAYWTNVLALVFTQPLHILLAYYAIQLSNDANYLMALAVCVLAARGPNALREYLVSTGVAAGATGFARFTIYQVMSRNLFQSIKSAA